MYVNSKFILFPKNTALWVNWTHSQDICTYENIKLSIKRPPPHCSTKTKKIFLHTLEKKQNLYVEVLYTFVIGRPELWITCSNSANV